jgi:DNA (cytosine-5)-methyltransferase 1
VDLYDQPHYYDRVQFYIGDAMEWLEDLANGERFAVGPFDAIHASPPCQGYTEVLHGKPDIQSKHPRLIAPVRKLLDEIGLPYVIENVKGARSAMLDPVTLCGAMDIFPDLRVIRHRLFETNWDLAQPEHPKKHPLVVSVDKRLAHYGKLNPKVDYLGVYGGGHGGTVDDLGDAMGIDWMTRKELNQAIPPAYAKYIGEQLKEVV